MLIKNIIVNKQFRHYKQILAHNINNNPLQYISSDKSILISNILN